MSSFEEPVGFSAWVGRHCRTGDHAVPKAGTKRRRLLLAMWEALVAEGIDVTEAARGLEFHKPEQALASVWGWAAARDDHGDAAGPAPGEIARRAEP